MTSPGRAEPDKGTVGLDDGFRRGGLQVCQESLITDWSRGSCKYKRIKHKAYEIAEHNE